jgi:hypothetical protein
VSPQKKKEIFFCNSKESSLPTILGNFWFFLFSFLLQPNSQPSSPEIYYFFFFFLFLLTRGRGGSLAFVSCMRTIHSLVFSTKFSQRKNQSGHLGCIPTSPKFSQRKNQSVDTSVVYTHFCLGLLHLESCLKNWPSDSPSIGTPIWPRNQNQNQKKKREKLKTTI